MLTKTILHYLLLGEFQTATSQMAKSHFRAIETKSNVDMRKNWSLGSVVLSRACFCQPETTSSAFLSPSKRSGFEQNEAQNAFLSIDHNQVYQSNQIISEA